jgi:hypothetical protein
MDMPCGLPSQDAPGWSLGSCRSQVGELRERDFSLSLAEAPTAFPAMTGRIVADCVDSDIGALGEVVERIPEQCWSLGAAQYLHTQFGCGEWHYVMFTMTPPANIVRWSLRGETEDRSCGSGD